VEESVRAAQSTAQREEALQCRREHGFRAEFTYICPRTYTFVRPHMRSHKQHPHTRSGLSHNACISLVLCMCDIRRCEICCVPLKMFTYMHMWLRSTSLETDGPVPVLNDVVAEACPTMPCITIQYTALQSLMH